MLLVLLPALVGVVSSKFVQMTLRENFTQTCPNVASDLIDRDSLKFAFEFVSGAGDGDQVAVVDQQGNSKTINFPGCYNVRLSFRLTQPVENPYIEAFLTLGQNLPCKNDDKPMTAATDICSNITQGTWCPQSSNVELRGMLEGKKTCQFCNLCNSVKAEQSELKKYIENRGSDQCKSDDNLQTLTFKMCTPSRREMREKEGDEKMEEYWSYLKQGVLTAVVHVMDRQEMSAQKSAQCKRMCSTYKSKKGVSKTYKRTLLKSIENLCAPDDTYAACVYHTQKFDVVSDF